MDQYFAAIFEDVRHERTLILLFSLTDLDILKQSKFIDYEIDIIKDLALEKLHRQRILTASGYCFFGFGITGNFLFNKRVHIQI